MVSNLIISIVSQLSLGLIIVTLNMDFYLTLPSNVHDNNTVESRKLVEQLWEQKIEKNNAQQRVDKLEQEEAAMINAILDHSADQEKWQAEKDKLMKEPPAIPFTGTTGGHINMVRAITDAITGGSDNIKDLDRKIETTYETIEKLQQGETRVNNEKMDAIAKVRNYTENITNLERELNIMKSSGNKTNHFRTQLPHPIHLEGDRWEVALVEFMFPKSWYNVDREQDNCINITMDGPFYAKLKQADNTAMAKIEACIPLANYDTPARLVEALNNNLEVKNKPWTTDHLRGQARFNYNVVKQRMQLVVSSNLLAVKLNMHLMYMLGFNYMEIYDFPPGKHEATYPLDLRAGFDSIYIYCDLVAPQIVGNTKAPLLRIISIQGDYGQMVNQIFPSPHYVPVLHRNFSSIKISINTDQDKPVPFQFGKSVVKLHFRKQKKRI